MERSHSTSEGDLLARIQSQLKPVLERCRAEKAIVFGSVARGDVSKHSDLDLIVIQRTKKRFFDRYSVILRDLFLAAPEWELNLLIYTPEELERMKGRPFIATALREGVTIYESK